MSYVEADLTDLRLDEQVDASARHVWQHAVAAQPWLDNWQLVRAEMPLIDHLGG
ncbi:MULTISPECIES: hypothetical protein [Streptomyces]|uniref:hypothetical protein n=1 Tax=Streptomyces lycopersici TaxID=2974589 RepID=UPI0021D329E6|nr:hypothetical protein [Streptomyces sp. NEAU-383]